LQQRVQSTAALHEEWTRAAAARGASPFRIAIHGLRGSMLPVIAQASLELPTMLTACFVVEHAFGLRGLGEATLRAVREGNVSWLMALSVCGVSWGIVALVASDVISALVDPRTRAALVRLGARS
jgi:peptide/nickel transport system permease protein